MTRPHAPRRGAFVRPSRACALAECGGRNSRSPVLGPLPPVLHTRVSFFVSCLFGTPLPNSQNNSRFLSFYGKNPSLTGPRGEKIKFENFHRALQTKLCIKYYNGSQIDHQTPNKSWFEKKAFLRKDLNLVPEGHQSRDIPDEPNPPWQGMAWHGDGGREKSFFLHHFLFGELASHTGVKKKGTQSHQRTAAR